MTGTEWTIAALGLVALGGVFWRMQGGFGPFNLRAVRIAFVGTVTALLAPHNSGGLTAGMGNPWRDRGLPVWDQRFQVSR